MNNIPIDVLVKLIIPALFVIAAILNHILNKEAQQAPAGPLPRRPPGGLPPAPMPGQRPAPREVIWQESPPPPRREPMAGPDEIIILGSETRPLRPGPAVPVRRRRRSTPPAPPKPEVPRPVVSTQRPAAPPPAPPVSRAAVPGLAALREALTSPARLREALIVRELLDRPLALRGRNVPGPPGA